MELLLLSNERILMRELGHPQMLPGNLSGKIFQDITRGQCLPKCLGISMEELGEVSGPDPHDPQLSVIFKTILFFKLYIY